MSQLAEKIALDAIDRKLVALLVDDARMTYQELGRAVRLSANTTADRARRLRSSGVIRGYHAAIDHRAIGRPLMLSATCGCGRATTTRSSTATWRPSHRSSRRSG